MALLTDQKRWDVWAASMERLSDNKEVASTSVLKANMRTLVNELDAWWDSGHKGQMATKISEPSKSGLSQAIKDAIDVLVSRKRNGENVGYPPGIH